MYWISALKQIRRPLLLICIFYIVFFNISGDPVNHTVALARSSYNQIFSIPSLFSMINISPNRLEKSKKNFEWSDWKNLSIVNGFENGGLSPAKYPIMSKVKSLHAPMMPDVIISTTDDQQMMSAFYCKFLLSAPKSIVTLENVDKDHLLSYKHRKRSLKIQRVIPADPAKFHLNYGEKKPQWLPLSEPLVPSLKSQSTSKGDLLFTSLDLSLFKYNPSDACLSNPEDKDRCARVMKALDEAQNSGKYFFEANIKDDLRSIGAHYDWRFFREILPAKQHKEILHSLARAWQQFADAAGIMYWYAHGSLLGYSWNGQALPWDSDHDIQLPIMEFDRLANDFNRTLVVQAPIEGNRSFILDINPNYVFRNKGNGNNAIDGRFIDVETGIYLDLTSVSTNGPATTSLKAKDGHTYDYKDYSRVRRTQFEGYPAFVPMHLEKELSKEYKNYLSPTFQGWGFNYQIQMWHSRTACQFPNAEFDNELHIKCSKRPILNNANDVQLYGTDDAYILAEAEATKPAIDNFNVIEGGFTVLLGSSDLNMLDVLYEHIGMYLPPVSGTDLAAQAKYAAAHPASDTPKSEVTV